MKYTSPILTLSQLDLNKSYTVADYLNWKFDELVELIKGKLYLMSPSPRSHHQSISNNIEFEIAKIIQGKSCKYFHAPFDVYLFGDQADKNTVVEPDICVICDRSKIQSKGCVGAPDWIVEILSPSTMKKDLNDKYNLYQEAGVKEYWVVYPAEKQVNVYMLDNQQYILGGEYTIGDQVPIGLWHNQSISCQSIFEDVDFANQ